MLRRDDDHILLTTYLSIVHLNSNAAVRVAGRDNNAVLPNGSEVEADLKLRVYHKLLRCKQQSLSSYNTQLHHSCSVR